MKFQLVKKETVTEEMLEDAVVFLVCCQNCFKIS